MTTRMAIPRGSPPLSTGAAERKTCATSRCRVMRAIFFALTVSWGFCPPVHAQISASLQQQVDAIRADRTSRTPAQKKIHSQLVDAARQAGGAAAPAGASGLRANLQTESDGRIKVKITAPVSQPLLDAITWLGGTVLSSYPKYSAIYALMPLTKLETLGARADVTFIGLPAKATFNDRFSRSPSPALARDSLTSSADIFVDPQPAGGRYGRTTIRRATSPTAQTWRARSTASPAPV